MLIAATLHRYTIVALFITVMYNGKRIEMCWECGLYCIYCWWGKVKEEYHPEDVGEMA
jgi:hypothetical protein